MKIKLTGEQVDEIVEKELKAHLKYQLVPESDQYETYFNRYVLILGFMRTLMHYSNPSDHPKIMDQVEKGLAKLAEYYKKQGKL